MELLEFTFQSVWHFFGMIILLFVVFVWPMWVITTGIAKKLRAHAEIVKLMEEYRRLKQQ